MAAAKLCEVAHTGHAEVIRQGGRDGAHQHLKRVRRRRPRAQAHATDSVPVIKRTQELGQASSLEESTALTSSENSVQSCAAKQNDRCSCTSAKVVAAVMGADVSTSESSSSSSSSSSSYLPAHTRAHTQQARVREQKNNDTKHKVAINAIRSSGLRAVSAAAHTLSMLEVCAARA